MSKDLGITVNQRNGPHSFLHHTSTDKPTHTRWWTKAAVARWKPPAEALHSSAQLCLATPNTERANILANP